MHWCVSAYSDGGCPRGRNYENFVGCPVLTELQEALEHGACILFMGKKTWKVLQTKKNTLGECRKERKNYNLDRLRKDSKKTQTKGPLLGQSIGA